MRPAHELTDAELQAEIAEVLGVEAWLGRREGSGRGGQPAAIILPSAGPRRWLASLLRRGAR